LLDYLFICLFIYLFISNSSKKSGKFAGYGTSLNELNVHTKQLPRKVTMNTLLYIYVEIKENFECITGYVKVEKQNNRTYNNY